jgi:hypothetical protein
MIEGSDFIIIAHHFSVSMKEQDPRSFGMAHVKAAQDENAFLNPYREVKGILRTGSKVLPRIEDVLQKEGMIHL